jgi:hypothetical protein
MPQYVYTITNDSITIFHNGKMLCFTPNDLNFSVLRSALLLNDDAIIEQSLESDAFMSSWSSGEFKLVSGKVFMKNRELPQSLSDKIIETARNGQSPEPFLNFWKKLMRNPSSRSVEQLFPFMSHAGIPVNKDGNILAYKSVRGDFLDHHSGTVLNTVGSVHEMERNLVSDDPNTPCHFGFHVGSLEYASSFGSGNKKMLICEVDPEFVVSVPNDCSHQKMRVCKYKVVGIYSEVLPSHYFDSYEDVDVEEDEYYDDDFDDYLDDDLCQVSREANSTLHGVYKVEDKKQTQPARKIAKQFRKIHAMSFDELLGQSTDKLRNYASKCLKIVNASKISGGKYNLVLKIIENR